MLLANTVIVYCRGDLSPEEACVEKAKKRELKQLRRSEQSGKKYRRWWIWWDGMGSPECWIKLRTRLVMDQVRKEEEVDNFWSTV